MMAQVAPHLVRQLRRRDGREHYFLAPSAERLKHGADSRAEIRDRSVRQDTPEEIEVVRVEKDLSLRPADRIGNVQIDDLVDAVLVRIPEDVNIRSDDVNNDSGRM
jgi:hypothetical protein